MASDLKTFYTEQLQDLYSANAQMAEFLPNLKNKAQHAQLKQGVDDAMATLRRQNDELAEVIRRHGADPQGEFCHGMAGLVKEGREHGAEADDFAPAVGDALLIALMQRMSHYGMAGYGTCLALAKHLDLGDDIPVLLEGLNNAKRGDEVMSQHAEGDLYPKAA